MIPLNNRKDYVVEISFTKTKMLIIAARKRNHFTMEFPKKQGKKMAKELGDDYADLAF